MMGERIEMPWRIAHICIYVRAKFGIFTRLLYADAVPERGMQHLDVWSIPTKYVPNYIRAIRMYGMMYNFDTAFVDVINFLEAARRTNDSDVGTYTADEQDAQDVRKGFEDVG